MERVAELMERWAGRMGVDAVEVRRWRAAGLLHDVLRDAPPQELRPLLGPEEAKLPDGILHGPAAVIRLRDEGVRDEGFLLAIGYHTLGHPGFDLLGRMLFAADFLEPGRSWKREWRGELRGRMPEEYPEVVRTVAGARIQRLLADARPLEATTVGFWNLLMDEVTGEQEERHGSLEE